MKLRSIRLKAWLLGGVLAAVVLGAGYYGARHYLWPAVKTWRVTRMNREASAFLQPAIWRMPC